MPLSCHGGLCGVGYFSEVEEDTKYGRELDRGHFCPKLCCVRPREGAKGWSPRDSCLATDRDWGKLVLLLEEDKRLTKEEERRNWDRQAVGEKSEEEKLNIKRRHH